MKFLCIETIVSRYIRTLRRKAKIPFVVIQPTGVHVDNICCDSIAVRQKLAMKRKGEEGSLQERSVVRSKVICQSLDHGMLNS